MKRVALVAFCCLFLAGCSNFSSFLPTTTPTIPTTPPKETKKEEVPAKLYPTKGKAVLTLRGQGVQVFRCSKDAQGAYYKFERPQARLFDKKGEEMAELSGPMSSFEHIDGSKIISARVIEYAEPKDSSKDILLVLMKAYSDPGNGAFNNVTYIQRLNPKGGMPSKGCTEADTGKLLEVPFSADYIFWK